MDFNNYIDVFIDESREHLQVLNESLLELEKNPGDLEIVNRIFRAAHTLKGMAATMGYNDLANLTHIMENVLDEIRNGKIEVSPDILDTIFLAIDDLESMVLSIENGGDGSRDVSSCIQKLEQITSGVTIRNEQSKSSIENETPLHIVYEPYEQTVIQQALEEGFNCLEIKVTLRTDCLLKLARVFMVFDVLEKDGEIVKTIPTVEELEAENFDNEFILAYITKDAEDVVEQKIMKIAEIELVDITKIDKQTLSAGEDKRAEEAVSTTEAANETTIEKTEELNTTTKKRTANKTIRVNIERLDILMNLFEELVIDKGRLEQIAQDLNHPELSETVEKMSRVSSDLQNIILHMRMVPVETVFNRFPRMIRQLSKELNKQLELEIIGAETELDRTVIDEIGDPIVHLLRNAVDHGIESPEERVAKGKSPTGKITLRAYHSGNHVFIEIEDNGSGINKEKVVEKAISKGMITSEDAKLLTEQEAYELILSPGFSTAEKISDISGRGVGLDVVKATIESLGGSITIESEEGVGSKFSIQLPLTLSIISSLLVEIGHEKYAIPLSSIIETAIIHRSQILSAHSQPVIDFRGNILPVIPLKQLFHVETSEEEDEYVSIVIVRKADKMAALIVDSFIGQQEIVLKSLGNYLKDVFAISGATILGDGQVALIIDCNALIK